MTRALTSGLRRFLGRPPWWKQVREHQHESSDREGCRHIWEIQLHLCRGDEQETLKCTMCDEMALVEPTFGVSSCPSRGRTRQEEATANPGRRLSITRRLEAGVFPPEELWPPDWADEIERLTASGRRQSIPTTPRPGDDRLSPGSGAG